MVTGWVSIAQNLVWIKIKFCTVRHIYNNSITLYLITFVSQHNHNQNDVSTHNHNYSIVNWLTVTNKIQLCTFMENELRLKLYLRLTLAESQQTYGGNLTNDKHLKNHVIIRNKLFWMKRCSCRQWKTSWGKSFVNVCCNCWL